jgi:peroxiredoxin
MLAYAIYEVATDDRETLKIGEQAPDFILEAMDGSTVQLSDFKGQGILLNFWGTYCPPCEKEMPDLESQYQQTKDTGVHILAVNVGEQKLTVQKFVEKYDLHFPILLDENSEVLEVYNVGALPATFLIDKNGKLIARILGGMTEADIAKYLDRVRP